MHEIRRKDKAITNETEMRAILEDTTYVTLAMCANDQPYLVTVNHGYDEEKNCIYFHCAREGKKIEILSANPNVWGQALIDYGYQQGKCDQLYKSVQFHGKSTFVNDQSEKEYALRILVRHLDRDPESVIKKQITAHSMHRVLIGRIDIDFMSGKKADKAIIQL
jgi:nitroimidazol reductase NimA-like FMN-containing flavoprotein (pyridoxamine 5'-phosphate oxidase superfamily)